MTAPALPFPSVSVVVPARNEEGNLESCLDVLVAALEKRFDRWEIIIVDDGSTDRTGTLADRLASEIHGVRAVHTGGRGFAAAYRHGLELARGRYVGLIPGDNEVTAESVGAIFDAVETADVVIPFTANQHARPWLRRALSRTFTTAVNVLFGHRLHYYQGPCVYPTELVRRLPVTTTGFAFLAEMLVRALGAGYRGVEVPMQIQPRAAGTSTAVSWHNVVTALRTVAVLVWDVKVRRKPLR